jgi:hypothetical protein
VVVQFYNKSFSSNSSSSPTYLYFYNTNSILQKSDMPQLADFKLPPINNFFNVYITIALNPNYFFVQSYDDLSKFNEMMLQLQAYCKSKKEFIPSDMIEEGQAYAIRSFRSSVLRNVLSILPALGFCWLIVPRHIATCGSIYVRSTLQFEK